MQYLLLFVAVALLGVALVLALRPRKAGTPVPESAGPTLGLAEPEPVLAPVLLPEHPTGADVEAVRLATALRGYRCEQGDGVLDAVGAELDRLRDRVQELEALSAGEPSPEVAPEASETV